MRELGNNIKIAVNDLSVSYNDEGKTGDPVNRHIMKGKMLCH